MKITMKRMELEAVQQVMFKLAGDKLDGVKFNYALTRNIKLLSGIIEAFPKLRHESQKLRHDVCVKHSKKTESGEPVILTNETTGEKTYDIADLDAFNMELTKLYEELKPKLDEERTFMLEDDEFELYEIKFEYLPEKGISVEELLALDKLIKEE